MKTIIIIFSLIFITGCINEDIIEPKNDTVLKQSTIHYELGVAKFDEVTDKPIYLNERGLYKLDFENISIKFYDKLVNTYYLGSENKSYIQLKYNDNIFKYTGYSSDEEFTIIIYQWNNAVEGRFFGRLHAHIDQQFPSCIISGTFKSYEE